MSLCLTTEHLIVLQGAECLALGPESPPAVCCPHSQACSLRSEGASQPQGMGPDRGKGHLHHSGLGH